MRLPNRGIPLATPITDPFNFDDLLASAQRALRQQMRHYMETVVRPAINEYWERGYGCTALCKCGNSTNRENEDDSDQSYDGDENITVTAQSGGHITIQVQNYNGGAPTDLTLTIEPPGGG